MASKPNILSGPLQKTFAEPTTRHLHIPAPSSVESGMQSGQGLSERLEYMWCPPYVQVLFARFGMLEKDGFSYQSCTWTSC